MAIPKTDPLLVPYVTNWDTRLADAPETYGLTEAQATALATASAPYLAAVTTLNNQRAIGTRAKSQTEARNQTRDAMLGVLRSLYALVQTSPSVTDANKTLLGVTIRSAPHPVPTPVDVPVVAVEKVVERTVTVSVRGSTNKAKKPDGAVSAYVYSYVGTAYPSDPSLWQFTGSATKPTYSFAFPDSVAPGAQVWVTAAWVNRKGEAGAPCAAVTTRLQFTSTGEPPVQMKIAA